MSPVFAKLNLKEQTEIVVLNAPDSFEPELAGLTGVTIRRDPAKVTAVAFALAFVMTEAEVTAAAAAVLPRAQGDAVVWFAYPKQSSKRYRCEFNRDSGWAPLGAAGFEGVRQVAIDEDWSALRFRRVEFVNVMTRDPKRAATTAGKAKTRAKK